MTKRCLLFMETVAIALFIGTYILLLVLPRFRAHVAVLAACAFVILGIVPLGMVGSAVDWNVILMISGTMGIVALFIESRMPARLADLIVEKTPNLRWAVVALSLFSSLISAFVDNVATVLMIGATLGGNLTPIGASANITGLGLLRKEGYEVKVGKFMRLSVPYTLAAVTTGYVLTWLIWGGAV